MQSITANISLVFFLIVWGGLWGIGGIWIVKTAFRLEKRIVFFAGIVSGLIIETLIYSQIGRFLPLDISAWIAAVLVAAVGCLMVCLFHPDKWRGLFSITIPVWEIIGFGAIFLLFFFISRGYAIYDDFAHLPTLSFIAAGNLPPVFALKQGVPYYYHSFLLIFSSQFTVLAKLFVWFSLDLGRALTYALGLVMVFFWGKKMCRSVIGGLTTSGFFALAASPRWLLLLLPASFVEWLSKDIQMLGSAAGSGENLLDALQNAWAIEGTGPEAFKFAFQSGLHGNHMMQVFSINSLVEISLVMLLLLSFNLWRQRSTGLIVTGVLLSAFGLLSEVPFLFILAGWGIVLIANLFRFGFRNLPVDFRWQSGSIILGALLSIGMNGTITEWALNFYHRFFTGQEMLSYQTMGVGFSFPPVMVSSHLGVFNLLDLPQLILAFLETGFTILALPLVIFFCIKAFKAKRWFEVFMLGGAILSLGTIFFVFEGSTGVRNTSRFYYFVEICTLWFVPLVWIWLRRKTWVLKAAAGLIVVVMMVGGLVNFKTMLQAVRTPVNTTFISTLDVSMLEQYWDTLPEESHVFSFDPHRTALVFARTTDSHLTWYEETEEFTELKENPSPQNLADFGYDYAYFDDRSWNEMDDSLQELYRGNCVIEVNSLQFDSGDFRRLVDISVCRSN